MRSPPIYTIKRVNQPLALTHPEMVRMLATWTRDTDQWAVLARTLLQGTATAIVGAVNEVSLGGILIIVLPGELGSELPQIVHFYCSAGPALKKALLADGVDYLRQNGYDRVWALNQSGRKDSVWSRAFKAAGSAYRIGTVMEFRLAERAQEPTNERNNKDPVRWGHQQIDPEGDDLARNNGAAEAVRGKVGGTVRNEPAVDDGAPGLSGTGASDSAGRRGKRRARATSGRSGRPSRRTGKRGSR